jgi:serine O-acetyltransferase
MQYKFSCVVSTQAIIEKGLILPHPIGIVVGTGVHIKKNTTIYQNVTIGRRQYDKEESPIIGENTIIYTGAIIVGDIVIGDNAVIQAHSVVNRNVPNDSVYTMNGKIYHRRE